MLLPKLDQLDLILTNQKSQDIHYLTYLIYKYCFDEQQQVLLTQKKLIVLICGRRAGKTVLIAALLILVAISYDRGDVIYLGRTATSAMQIIWRTLMEILKFTMLPYKQNLSEQYIELNTGVRIYVKGTNTKEDIENLRGMSLRLAVKDECQGDAHGKLKMLVEEVLGPATKDFADSQILLAGSPPRIEGSYQEELYASDSPFIARYNWNMSVNPHIPNHEHILEETLEKDFAGNANDTVYLREHCGKIGVYDTEALVFRIQPGNYYQEAQFAAWINSQPITDIFLSAGVDYGFDDQDSCVIIVASERKPERFLIYEYKGNRSGITDFANQMKRGLFLVTSNPILAKVNKGFTWYCDTEGLGKKIT
jgi:phage terminase large subunit